MKKYCTILVFLLASIANVATALEIELQYEADSFFELGNLEIKSDWVPGNIIYSSIDAQQKAEKLIDLKKKTQDLDQKIKELKTEKQTIDQDIRNFYLIYGQNKNILNHMEKNVS